MIASTNIYNDLSHYCNNRPSGVYQKIFTEKQKQIMSSSFTEYVLKRNQQ